MDTYRMESAIWRTTFPLSTYCDIKTKHHHSHDWWLIIRNEMIFRYEIRVPTINHRWNCNNRNDCVVLNGWNLAANPNNDCICAVVVFSATRVLRENIFVRVITHHSSLISFVARFLRTNSDHFLLAWHHSKLCIAKNAHTIFII